MNLSERIRKWADNEHLRSSEIYVLANEVAWLEKERGGYKAAMDGAVCGQCCDNFREIVAGRKSVCPACSGIGYTLLTDDDEPDPEWAKKGRGYSPQCTRCTGRGMINHQAREESDETKEEAK